MHELSHNIVTSRKGVYRSQSKSVWIEFSNHSREKTRFHWILLKMSKMWLQLVKHVRYFNGLSSDYRIAFELLQNLEKDASLRKKKLLILALNRVIFHHVSIDDIFVQVIVSLWTVWMILCGIKFSPSLKIRDGMNKFSNCARKIDVICVNVRFHTDNSRHATKIKCKHQCLCHFHCHPLQRKAS